MRIAARRGVGAQRRQQRALARRPPVSDSGDTASSIAARCPPAATPGHALCKLAAIGTLAGVFSGLFGVGGGTVIVPLLIFWFGYGERLATGTSLAAIVLIGLLGALAQGGIYGNVHVVTGLLLAIPAVARRRHRHRDPAADPPARRLLPLRRRCWSRSRSS